MNWKPDSSTWGIAQHMAHPIVINTSYPPMIEVVRQGAYKPILISKIGFIASSIGNPVLKAVHLDRKRKLNPFPFGNLPKARFQKEYLTNSEHINQN